MTHSPYRDEQPTREAVDALPGATVLNFGTSWCGICQAAAPAIHAAVDARPVVHLKVADGKGRPLGRSFGVKLWPTLVFLRDGREVERLVRPTRQAEIDAALDRLLAAPA